ncbi:MAG TPA: DUF1592 domain-containing protein [Candidatus Binatia bacterium]|jgi:hypothetical protein|nr:DUF1592 domain-containing protein [Candidatus Binatia bacterium]
MNGRLAHWRWRPAHGSRDPVVWCQAAVWLVVAAWSGRASAASLPGAEEFHQHIQPVLEEFCYDCHGDGMNKGGVAFDGFESDSATLASRDIWWKALKNLRAGLMPPAKKPRPAPEQKERIYSWIKSAVFQIDPQNPDPGRVTVRRLNRVEYRNTIRDLMSVDYDTEVEFPPDDTGYGFDTIGDVLTVSPVLLEKYLAAAGTIVAEAVPTHPKASGETRSPASKNYSRFFTKDEAPQGPAERRSYAQDVLRRFASQAFRRPVDDATLGRLVSMAEESYTGPHQTFEAGIAQAMTAVLASPRFLFREEQAEPSRKGQPYPFVDEYSLASRLSYFLWSSMPDDELFRLAREHKLRANLAAQVARMLADPRSYALIRNFTGQWLQARDVESVEIDARSVFARERKIDPEMERLRARFRELRNRPEESLTPAEKEEFAKVRAEFFQKFGRSRLELTGELREAMRQETEKCFEYVVRQDRPVTELLESHYTFLNERLAKHYGIEGVTGKEMRLVTLPADNPRGGILGQGTFLLVTSNPTRTSPVKRGLFILDNVLGMPTPPPPPNIPPLEDAAKDIKDHEPTLRETLALHRSQPLCSSCHNRMDPLGLALENFNAMGLWRVQERGRPIETAGKLITGESFENVQELKHILATEHRRDFYRCLAEKLLTYAVGRGLEYYDVETVDQLVAGLDHAEGRFSTLLTGIVESAPFEKCRTSASLAYVAPSKHQP